jgi:hypothetical protein
MRPLSTRGSVGPGLMRLIRTQCRRERQLGLTDYFAKPNWTKRLRGNSKPGIERNAPSRCSGVICLQLQSTRRWISGAILLGWCFQKLSVVLHVVTAGFGNLLASFICFKYAGAVEHLCSFLVVGEDDCCMIVHVEPNRCPPSPVRRFRFKLLGASGWRACAQFIQREISTFELFRSRRIETMTRECKQKSRWRAGWRVNT